MNLAYFFLLAAFWGGSFVAIKFVVSAFPPLFGAFLRVAVALVALSAVFLLQGRDLRVPRRTLLRMWLAGLFAQGFPFLLLFWGERLISPGLAGIINGTVPLWTFCLGLLRGSEHFNRRKTAGLFLGFLGIGVICAPLVAFSGTPDELKGTAAVLVMALCYAVGSLMTRSLLSGGAKADFRSNVVHQTTSAAVFLLLASKGAEAWPPAAEFLSAHAALGSVLYLGLFSTALAFLMFYHLIREWGAVRATAVTYVAPVFAVFWDFVFFRNVPRAWEFAGVALILSGVLLLHEPAPPKAA